MGTWGGGCGGPGQSGGVYSVWRGLWGVGLGHFAGICQTLGAIGGSVRGVEARGVLDPLTLAAPAPLQGGA